MLGGNFRTIDRPILFILVIWNRLRQRLKVIKFVCFQKHNDVKWTWQKTWFNKAEIRSRRISQNEIIDFSSTNNVGYFVSHFVLVHQVDVNFELNQTRLHHLVKCWNTSECTSCTCILHHWIVTIHHCLQQCWR